MTNKIAVSSFQVKTRYVQGIFLESGMSTYLFNKQHVTYVVGLNNNADIYQQACRHGETIPRAWKGVP
jgi:hypothetical protein